MCVLVKNREFWCRHCKSIVALVVPIAAIAWAQVSAQETPRLFQRIEPLTPPWLQPASEPSLTTHEGALYMSWTEQEGRQTKIMMAIWDADRWSKPQVVHQGDDIFVNWADFPGIAVFDDGTIAVHWLREIGPSSYSYQVEIALSGDGGITWSEPLIPHDDRSFTQHGFLSMLPSGQNALVVIWLDGRAYGAEGDKPLAAPDAMQLRATTLTGDGVLGRDIAIDLQTCSCCQTSLAATDNGVVLAAYRNRTEGEIRDISVARLTGQGWQQPVTVHDDGWELAGCPVNGPAIAAEGDTTAVAWFTGANDVPAVNVAFSDDGALSFGLPVQVDLGNPVGRVDLEILDDRSALVSWVEWMDGNEALFLCRVDRNAGCIERHLLAINSADASVNFPRIARLGEEVFVAWTQPDTRGDGLALRRALLANVDR